MTAARPLTDAPAKGVVAPDLAGRTFRMARYLPGLGLAPFLDHVWVVEWDLDGRPPFVQRTLPYPCVHVVFDRARSGIWGVPTGPFDYELKGAGKVCGLRFKAGAFRGLLGRSLHTITDRVLALDALFPWHADAACAAVLGQAGDAHMIAAAESLLLPSLPPPDPQVDRIGAILHAIEHTPGLTQVGQVADHAGMHVRSLQQLFGEYVGVSPKWTIRRFRLHEAADRLARDEAVDLAGLAHDLGYFDQAHFSADFKRLVGEPPGRYRGRARGAGG